MTQGAAPDGWYPDPGDEEWVSYWDGEAWTERKVEAQPPGSAAERLNTPPGGPNRVGPEAASPATSAKRAWSRLTPGAKVATASVAGFLSLGVLVAGIAVDSSTATAGPSPVASSSTVVLSPTAAGTASPSAVASSATVDRSSAVVGSNARVSPTGSPSGARSDDFGRRPDDEQRALAALTAARATFSDEGATDLQKRTAIPTGERAFCSAVGSGLVSGWTGRLKTLGSDKQGHGIVSVEVADDIEVTTRNSFVFDAVDHTLVPPGRLLTELTTLHEGDVVTFSGRFTRPFGGEPCVNNSRLTREGKALRPSLIFRFSDISKS